MVSVAAMLGAILAFLSARYVFFDAIHRAARTRPRLQRWLAVIDRGLRDHGAYYVLLLRLTPVIPFWALNLGLGLTAPAAVGLLVGDATGNAAGDAGGGQRRGEPGGDHLAAGFC